MGTKLSRKYTKGKSIHAEAYQSDQISRVGDETFDQILGMTRYQKCDYSWFSLNQLSRILATIKLCRPGKDRTDMEASSRRGFRGG